MRFPGKRQTPPPPPVVVDVMDGTPPLCHYFGVDLKTPLMRERHCVSGVWCVSSEQLVDDCLVELVFSHPSMGSTWSRDHES